MNDDELRLVRAGQENRVEDPATDPLNSGALLHRAVNGRSQTEKVIGARLRLLRFAATHTLDELLEETLNEAEALTGSLIGFFHFFEADQKTLSLQNWSTRTKAEFCTADGNGLHYGLSTAGVWADCIRERRPVIHNDYASLTHRRGLPPGHAPVVRELVLPVFRNDRIMAILGVGNKPTEYTRQDVETVSLLSDLAWEIAERKQAEASLLFARFCVDKAAFGIFQTDENGTVFSVNDYACKSLGYTKDELCRMSVFEFDPAITPKKMREIREMLDDTGQATHETIHVRRDGTTFPVEITTNLLDFRGKTFGVSFVKDITERKRSEEMQRKSRQMMMVVLDNFPGVVFWKDRDSRYLGCNRNFSLAAGLADTSEIIGRTDYQLPWKDDAERYLADDRQVMESGLAKMNIVEPLLHADGRVLWFETCKVPLYGADDKVIGVLGTSNDITERKRAEEALRKAHDELESRVRKRTGQLTSLAAELSLAEEQERRRIATELHDQVGQNLIMSKIRLDSLKPALPPEEFSATLAETREQITRAIEGIRTLTFQLSPPLLYEVGFEAAVEWLAEEFEQRHGFQVDFRDDGKPKPLEQEAAVALYQMVRELLINVVKHARAKRVRISIERDSDRVRISVKDDGSGSEHLNGIWGTNQKRGFGLFTIRQRIEYMGGTLACESSLGHGTRVTLLLPFKRRKKTTDRRHP